MLLSLRHPAIVRRHHQHRAVHRADAGHHVFDKIFMARHIHNANTVSRLTIRRTQTKMRKAQFNGDSAFFFLRQAVRITATQGADQRALAVVNVAGGCQDVMQIPHHL